MQYRSTKSKYWLPKGMTAGELTKCTLNVMYQKIALSNYIHSIDVKDGEAIIDHFIEVAEFLDGLMAGLKFGRR